MPAERRVVLGRVGAALALVLFGLGALGVVTLALVLGYLIAGLVVAAILVAVFVALLRGAFAALRR